MSEVFGAGYAGAYDALYRTKDYAGEVDLIVAAFREFDPRPIARILDLGCGTGGHAIPLARRGHQVVGVDRSAEMLAQARAKGEAAGVGGQVDWVHHDVATVRVTPPADAALLMFAVLGYLETPERVVEALRTAHGNLRPGGLLLFDAWYGPAVEAQRPESRERAVEDGGARVIRSAEGTLDKGSQVVRVKFRLRRESGDRVVAETEEEHRMRYFFRDELARLLGAAGFELLRLTAFPEVARAPDESTWSVLAVARRVAQMPEGR